MDDLKALYFRIENPIDNDIKWNRILNIYSTSIDFDDFYSNIANTNYGNECHFDSDKKTEFLLMMWSIWKQKTLAMTIENIKEYVETKELDASIYEAIRKVRNLDSVRSYESLKKVLSDRDIRSNFSNIYSENSNSIRISSNVVKKRNPDYNTSLTVCIDANNLYTFLITLINHFLNNELPYYIVYNENGKDIIMDIYTSIINAKKVESIINTLKKENYIFFKENKSRNLLAGNINEWISIKNSDILNNEAYKKNRCKIIFKSLDSVMYEYVINHLNILVSYKDGRMNLIEYLASNVTEQVVSNLLNATAMTEKDYFYVANSDDLMKLKEYIENRLSFSMRDILKDKLYLKGENDKIDFKLNSNKNIDIEIKTFMSAIRNLALTLLLKDSALEKAFRIRIKNECQFYKVDPEKFCLDLGFSKKIFFNEAQFNRYQKEVDSIRNDIEKFDNLEKLINSEITEDTRKQIATTMGELISMFED